MGALRPILSTAFQRAIVDRLPQRKGRMLFSRLDPLVTADRIATEHSGVWCDRELGSLLEQFSESSDVAWQRRILRLVHNRFQCRYAALIGDAKGTQSVRLAAGHLAPRFKHALLGLVAPFFLRGETSVFGYRCCGDRTLPELTLQTFGVERMIVYPLKLGLQRESRSHVLWLGYGDERLSGGAVRRLLELLRRVESELVFTRRISALERAAIDASKNSADKSRELADYSHDLCAALHNIELALELLGQQRDSSDLPLIAIASAHCRDLLDLSKGILEVSRDSVVAGRPDRAPFDLGSLCRERVERVRLQAEILGVSLSCSGSEILVNGDQRQLGRVLQNLISNALRSITKGAISVDWGASGTDVWFSVRDTGCGMTEAALAAGSAKESGVLSETGYQHGYRRGLPLVRSIIAAHHGSIKIESIPGSGTTVTVVLPEAAC